MSVLTAQQAFPLQIEGFSPYIAEALEFDGRLARLLGNGSGGATKVSIRPFRARLKTAVASNVAQVSLETGSLPGGVGNKYDQFLLTPQSYVIPFQYSRLAKMVGQGDNVATNDAVADSIADIARITIKFRDIFLQTSGDGSLASVDSTTGLNQINLRSSTTAVIDGRGGHLVQPQMTVQIMSPTSYTLRGACTISTVANFLGSTQSIQVDVIPPGTVAGDLVIIGGATPGGPTFINGIPTFVNTLTTGNLYGLSRGLPYVQANGVPMAGAQVTKPIFRVAQNQIVQRLGEDGLADQFWHTHESQIQAFEEMAFADTFVPLNAGKAKLYDPLFQEFTINGRPIVMNIHADQTRWDLLLAKGWSTVKWGAGAFWFTNEGGQKVFQLVDPATGNPQVQELMYWTVAEQWYFSNPMAQGGMTNCKIPAFN